MGLPNGMLNGYNAWRFDSATRTKASRLEGSGRLAVDTALQHPPNVREVVRPLRPERPT